MSGSEKPDGDLPFLSRWAKRKIAATETPSAASVQVQTNVHDPVRGEPVEPQGRLARDSAQPIQPFDKLRANSDGDASGPELVNASTGEPSEAKTPATPQPEPGLANNTELRAPLPPIETLTHEADFTPFMARDVDPALRNQAMKKLFADPHYGFDKMDKLDIYIDDYSKPDPIPLEMLKMLYQSKSLFLFDEEEKEADEMGAKDLGNVPTDMQREPNTTGENAQVADSRTTKLSAGERASPGATDENPIVPAQLPLPNR